MKCIPILNWLLLSCSKHVSGSGKDTSACASGLRTKALLLLISKKITLKNYPAIVLGECLIHARMQTIAENTTSRYKFVLIKKKSAF